MEAPTALMEITVRQIGVSNNREESPDVLAVEEPLEIRLGYHENSRPVHKSVSITMRTPGDDVDLATGFLFTEGIITLPRQIKQIQHCGLKRGWSEKTGALSNTIRIDLQNGVGFDLKRLERHFYTSSSCGVCGKSSIEALKTGAEKINNTDLPKIDGAFINRMPAELMAAQTAFKETGGLHASALFDVNGGLEIVREDVGRHNALDKVIGAKFLNNELPLSDKILLVSGRASFELVQKALMAGIPILAAVGAPSSLAVQLAREFGMTLIGFVRDGRFNIYCGSQRISEIAERVL